MQFQKRTLFIILILFLINFKIKSAGKILNILHLQYIWYLGHLCNAIWIMDTYNNTSIFYLCPKTVTLLRSRYNTQQSSTNEPAFVFESISRVIYMQYLISMQYRKIPRQVLKFTKSQFFQVHSNMHFEIEIIAKINMVSETNCFDSISNCMKY